MSLRGWEFNELEEKSAEIKKRISYHALVTPRIFLMSLALYHLRFKSFTVFILKKNNEKIKKF